MTLVATITYLYRFGGCFQATENIGQVKRKTDSKSAPMFVKQATTLRKPSCKICLNKVVIPFETLKAAMLLKAHLIMLWIIDTTVKPVLSSYSKIDETKVLKTGHR